MEDIKQLLLRYGPQIIGALVFAITAYIISGWLGRVSRKALLKAKIEATLADFLGSLVRWGLFVLAMIACLGVFGVETASFAAVLAGAGLAIGLAVQGTLSNLAAGVMLMVFRPFKLDQFVSIAGHIGKVSEITLFTTNIDTPDNRRIIIPNSAVFGSTIENLTYHPIRRVDISVGVEYPADADRTREVLEAAAKTVPGAIDDPAPQIILLSLGDSALDWQMRVWTKTENYWDVVDAATRSVKVALDEAGLGIPFPQIDVHLDSPVA